LDVSKGFLPTYIALNASQPDWVVALTATFTVIGHCWPIFAGFHGGMGLATTGGILLAVSPKSFLGVLAILLISVLILRYSARGAVIAALISPWIVWLLGFRGIVLLVGVPVSIVIAVRFYVEDWNREY
jgi:glycerol-3-phosphate acyltransferase PlsY